MSVWNNFLMNLPEVAGPTQRKLGFKEKMKWTVLVLVLYYILRLVPLFGLGPNELRRFEYLSVILGAEFGSIISLGIGPLVTASIVLQLLNGSGLWKFDTSTHEGKRMFQGIQKLFSFFFIIFEGCIYVFMGGLAPPALIGATQIKGTSLFFELELLLVFQLFLGGVLILFMDEIVSKWGFGSGISLFIAAGVSQQLFVRTFSWLPAPGTSDAASGFTYASGALPALVQSLSSGDPSTAGLMLGAVVSTLLIFVIAVYGQSMKVEIPLSFGRVRGHGIRWPLSFMYTSNIPVILVAALIANIQLWGRLLQNWGHPLLGTFVGNSPSTGLVAFLSAPNMLNKILTGSVSFSDMGHALVYMLIMMLGAMMFSYFWVQTSGMDAKSQAKQMMASGLQIPGFRRDARVMERLLERYITPLTIMGGLSIGFLAALADLSGALVHGTSLLLTIMIIYRLYEDIAKQHLYDMHPALRKFMEV